jgi:PHD/YefM family antitoxin component YafN of YafNO toxin-antitoxin module
MRRTFTASEFKTKFHALLRQVEETRKPIVITKDGKPIALMRPHRRMMATSRKSAQSPQ